MVMLVNPGCIAIYCILRIVFCSSSVGAIYTVYANEQQKASLTLKLPTPFERDIQVVHTREDGKHEKVAFFRTDSSIGTFTSWKHKLEALFHREGKVGFTIKNVRLEDAGEFVCVGEGKITYPDCGCLLVIIVKPNRPVISTLTETSFQCKHSSRTRPNTHELDHTTKWLDGKGAELDVSKSDTFSVNDRGELHINNAHAIDKSLTLKCKTADVVDSTTSLSLQFSDPSAAFIFKGLPKTIITAQTTSTSGTSSIRPITADMSTKNSSLSTDDPSEINDGSSPILMIGTFAALFGLVFGIFFICNLLMKKKTELKHVQESSESVMKAPTPAIYQIGHRKESEIN